MLECKAVLRSEDLRIFTLPTVLQNRRKLLAPSPCNNEEQEREEFVTRQGGVAETALPVAHLTAADIPGRIYPMQQTSLGLSYQLLVVLTVQTFLGGKTWEMGFTKSKGLSRLPLSKGHFYLLLH